MVSDINFILQAIHDFFSFLIYFIICSIDLILSLEFGHDIGMPLQASLLQSQMFTAMVWFFSNC